MSTKCELDLDGELPGFEVPDLSYWGNLEAKLKETQLDLNNQVSISFKGPSACFFYFIWPLNWFSYIKKAYLQNIELLDDNFEPVKEKPN